VQFAIEVFEIGHHFAAVGLERTARNRGAVTPVNPGDQGLAILEGSSPCKRASWRWWRHR